MRSAAATSRQNQGKIPSKNFLEILKKGEVSTQSDLGPFSSIELGRLAEKQEKLGKQYNQEVVQRIESLQKQEIDVWNRERYEVKLEIEVLRSEIKKLSKSLKMFQAETRETEKTIDLEIVDPGTYHVGFFAKVRSFIVQLRKKIDDAGLWLEAWNQKKKKRGFFWGVFFSKRGGAKYVLSSEHYVSRSAG